MVKFTKEEYDELQALNDHLTELKNDGAIEDELIKEFNEEDGQKYQLLKKILKDLDNSKLYRDISTLRMHVLLKYILIPKEETGNYSDKFIKMYTDLANNTVKITNVYQKLEIPKFNIDIPKENQNFENKIYYDILNKIFKDYVKIVTQIRKELIETTKKSYNEQKTQIVNSEYEILMKFIKYFKENILKLDDNPDFIKFLETEIKQIFKKDMLIEYNAIIEVLSQNILILKPEDKMYKKLMYNFRLAVKKWLNYKFDKIVDNNKIEEYAELQKIFIKYYYSNTLETNDAKKHIEILANEYKKNIIKTFKDTKEETEKIRKEVIQEKKILQEERKKDDLKLAAKKLLKRKNQIEL